MGDHKLDFSLLSFDLNSSFCLCAFLFFNSDRLRLYKTLLASSLLTDLLTVNLNKKLFVPRTRRSCLSALRRVAAIKSKINKVIVLPAVMFTVSYREEYIIV